MNLLKKYTTLLTVFLGAFSFAQAENYEFSFEDKNYGDYDANMNEFTSGTWSLPIKESSYAFFELNLNNIRESVSTNAITKVTFQVYGIWDINNLEVYSIYNSNSLTGYTQMDYSRGYITKDSLLDTVEYAQECTVAEFDVTDYVISLLQRETITFAGLMLVNGEIAGYNPIWGNNVDEDMIYNPKYVVSTIPEPSTYAVIFATLALAFVIYRKRK